MCSGSRVQQDQSKVTILAVVKFCEDKFTTTASELRPAIVQFSGKSHQPHHQIHLMLEPEPPLMRQLVLVPSFSFQTWVLMDFPRFQFLFHPPLLSSLNNVEVILELKEWEPLPLPLSVSTTYKNNNLRQDVFYSLFYAIAIFRYIRFDIWIF